MILMEEGVIDLFEPVGNYIDTFRNQMVSAGVGHGGVPTMAPGREQRIASGGYLVPADSPVTIKDLLDMTSGLTYGGESLAERYTSAVIQEAADRLHGDHPMDTMEFAERIGECPLEFQPGSQMRYGVSADILGAVIQKASGMTFGEFLKKRIFEPLGMEDTAFCVPDDKRDRLSGEYVCDGHTIGIYHGDNLAIRDDAKDNPFESGGAGLFSTLSDYAKFAAMLMNDGTLGGRRILRPGTVKFMTSGELLPHQQLSFNWQGLEGYTYSNLMRVVKWPDRAGIICHKGEYGWDGWLGPYFANDPETGLTVLMMIQRKDYGTGTVTRRLRNIIFS